MKPVLVFAWYWRDARDGWRRGTFEAARRRGDVRVMVRYANRLIRELSRLRAFDTYLWQPRLQEWKKTEAASEGVPER